MIQGNLISPGHLRLAIQNPIFDLGPYPSPPKILSKMHAAYLLLAAFTGVSAVTTTLPASAGTSSVPTAIPVKGSFDGGMKRFERNRES